MTKNPLRSDPQPLAASERPLAPDAPNGLTSGPESYTDVIRGVYEAEEFLIQESVINRASLDTIIRLTRERDEALATIARMRTNRPASHTGLTERTS